MNKKRFPVEKLSVGEANLSAGLVFNPYANLPPSLWWNLYIPFDKVDLGDLAVAPQTFGTVLETDMRLDGMDIPERRWMNLVGPYVQTEPWRNGSIYVCNAHNPVGIKFVAFPNRRGQVFDFETLVTIDFGAEMTPYEDSSLRLTGNCVFTGLVFHEPQWNDPEEVRFPSEWRIPAKYTKETVTEMMSRFVDVDCYSLSQKETTFEYKPREL